MRLVINVNKSYVRDSEVTWLNDTWIYDLVLPFIFRANMSFWNYQLDFGEDFHFRLFSRWIFMVGILMVACVIFKIQKNNRV